MNAQRQQRRADRPPYTGDGLECIGFLTHETNAPHVLDAVAAWHEARYPARHKVIARALREAAMWGRTKLAAAA